MNPSMPVQLLGLQPIDQDAGNDVSHDPQVEDVHAVEEQSGPIVSLNAFPMRLVCLVSNATVAESSPGGVVV